MMSSAEKKRKKKFRQGFKKELEEYNHTFNEEVKYIYLKSFYINIYNELEPTSKDQKVYLLKGRLYRDDFIEFIKENANHSGKKYDVFSQLKYNFNLNYDDILTYNNSDYDNSFLTKIKDVEEMLPNDYILWKDTLRAFKKFNALYIFYKEIAERKEEATKEEATKEEATKEEPTKEEATKEEATKEEPTKEEPTKEEPTKEEPTKEEPTERKLIIDRYRKIKRKRPRSSTKRIRKKKTKKETKEKKKEKKRRRRRTRKLLVYQEDENTNQSQKENEEKEDKEKESETTE